VTYCIDEVDRAGNCHPIAYAETIPEIIAKWRRLRAERPACYHIIYNPDAIDVDCHDGLTEAEWEMLP
jgi:hypothetical protein